MKVNLISFQDKAVKDLRVDIADALDNYRRRKKTQVVSLQAPTGAGKTIIAAGLIEDIYFGSTLADGTTFDEQPEAIFVWLSDSPELNAQSKQKIELKTSKLRFGQCVTIAEDSFDMEMLEDHTWNAIKNTLCPMLKIFIIFVLKMEWIQDLYFV